MIQLNESQYNLLLEPLAQVDFNTYFIRSIIAGHVEGKVFANSANDPKSFYAISKYGMSLLFGDPDNPHFNAGLLDYFASKSVKKRTKDEWLQAHPRAWDFMLDALVDKGKAKRYSRINFTFDKSEFIKNNSLISYDDYLVIPTTAAMFNSIQGAVAPSAFWRNETLFLQESTSFTVVIDGQPASTAFASYRHDQMLEIGIETNEKYRGKGLAYIACAILINYCIKNNLEPMWSCRLENAASVKLAKKLGFKQTLVLPYYHISV